MATISSPGIGSGLDINSIVTQLVAVERRPIQQLQSRATAIQARLSAMGQLKSQLSALADASDKLANPSAWNRKLAASSDAAAVTATVSPSYAANGAGSISINVQRLATAQSLASSPLVANQGVGEGKIVIQLGSWNSAGDTFTPSSAPPVEIDITAGNNTPSEVASRINAAAAGVTATTITDAAGTRLVVRSAATGQAGGFQLSATETGASAPGLERLSYPSGTMTRTQAAGDALVSLNGVDISSASNRLDSALTGLSLDLLRPTTSPVEVSVAPDAKAQRALVDDFITAYNTLNKTLSSYVAYNAETRTGGALQGEQTAVAIQSGLRTALRSTVASGAYTRLADVGIQQARDGSLSIDEQKMASALARGDDLGSLFNRTGTPGTSDGIARRVASLAKGLAATDGALTTRTSALQDNARRNSEAQDRLNDRVALVEKRLRTQYAALDKSMSGLNALSSYVSQQVTLWNKSTG